MPDYNKIKLKGTPRYEEARAAGNIKAGHWLQKNSAGAVVVQAAANGRCQKLIADEGANVLQGKGLEDVYASGDLVSYWACKSGDVVWSFIDAGETILIGDPLRQAGNGTLEKATADTDRIVAWAEEAIDLAQTGDVSTRIPVTVA